MKDSKLASLHCLLEAWAGSATAMHLQCVFIMVRGGAVLISNTEKEEGKGRREGEREGGRTDGRNTGAPSPRASRRRALEQQCLRTGLRGSLRSELDGWRLHH